MKGLSQIIIDEGAKLRGYRKVGWSGRMKRAYRNVKTFCCCLDYREVDGYMMTLTSVEGSKRSLMKSFDVLRVNIRRGLHTAEWAKWDRKRS